MLLGAGLGVAQPVEDLYVRSAAGLAQCGAAAVALLALIVIIAREAFGLARLATIEKLHQRAEDTIASDSRTEADASSAICSSWRRATRRWRAPAPRWRGHRDDIIDGADMLRLAERELMTPLDREARRWCRWRRSGSPSSPRSARAR